MQPVTSNVYVAYRAMRGRLADTLYPPDLDPLCSIIVWMLWRDGRSRAVADLRNALALPASTMSSALRRLEERGLIRRSPHVDDARYRVATLTLAGTSCAAPIADMIGELERDVHETAGPDARLGLDRVATMLAAMDEEAYVGRFR